MPTRLKNNQLSQEMFQKHLVKNQNDSTLLGNNFLSFAHISWCSCFEEVFVRPCFFCTICIYPKGKNGQAFFAHCFVLPSHLRRVGHCMKRLFYEKCSIFALAVAF